MRASLANVPVARLIGCCHEAADIFLKETLPLGDDRQGPEDYVEQVSATTGMPFAMVRRNMARVANVMTRVEDILRGLTRGLDLGVLDRGIGEVGGHAVSFFPRTRALGIVLPSNSPGVHGLWIPAIAMKTPLVLKPGGAEPWTPYRIIQALMKAGVPADAFTHDRPPLPATDETSRSSVEDQSSAASRPKRILLYPGPCSSIRGSPANDPTADVSPKNILRPVWRTISPAPA